MGRRLLVVPVVGALCLVGALWLTATQATAARWVSYPTLLREARSGPVIRAIINPWLGDVEIKFRDLSEWHAFYPARARPALQRVLSARHIRVLFVKRHHASTPKPATVHHHLRYIAAGLTGGLTMIAAGAFLYSRRRRQEE